MRADISSNRLSWFYRLDYRKLILAAFLLRFIAACTYDIFVSVTDRDILFPDSKFYSTIGRYITLLLNRYDKEPYFNNIMLDDKVSRAIFIDTLERNEGHLPKIYGPNAYWFYIIGYIYFIFGYFPLGVRVFNIFLSIASTYFLFKIAKRHFGELTANLFLLIALFLPTQFGYSITFSKDFVRMFIISFALWLLYGGVICIKRQGL